MGAARARPRRVVRRRRDRLRARHRPPDPPVAGGARRASSRARRQGPAHAGAGPIAGDDRLVRHDERPPRCGAGAAADEAQALPSEGVVPSLNGAVQWPNFAARRGGPARQGGPDRLLDLFLHQRAAGHPYVRGLGQEVQGPGPRRPRRARAGVRLRAGTSPMSRRRSGISASTTPSRSTTTMRSGARSTTKYWPAHYFIDAKGRIRHHHFGEGEYDGSGKVIQALLAEAGHAPAAASLVTVDARGVHAAADMANVQSPETYIGYERAENFASPGGADARQGRVLVQRSAVPGSQPVEPRRRLDDRRRGRDPQCGGRDALTYRFHARDLHLVLGPGSDEGKPVRFACPGRRQAAADGPWHRHGCRRQRHDRGPAPLSARPPGWSAVVDRTFEIEFLDPGAHGLRLHLRIGLPESLPHHRFAQRPQRTGPLGIERIGPDAAAHGRVRDDLRDVAIFAIAAADLVGRRDESRPASVVAAPCGTLL